jgi:hypothetical protein
MITKTENISRLMYGALLSVLLLQLFIVVVAPFAAHVGYPLVVTESSGVATTIYPGPLLIVAAMVAGFAIALTTPRRYYGVWAVVIVILLIMLGAALIHMSICDHCKVKCNPYPMLACGLDAGFFYIKLICVCYVPYP